MSFLKNDIKFDIFLSKQLHNIKFDIIFDSSLTKKPGVTGQRHKIMTTITINTERELKNFVKENRKNITSINNVVFNELYPMLEVSNKHASYYNVYSQDNEFLYSPFLITLK